MLTKRQLFEQANKSGNSLINSPKEYKDGIGKILYAEYGEVDSSALENFVKNFCCYVSSQLAKLKNISVKKKHERFLANKVVTLMKFQANWFC